MSKSLLEQIAELQKENASLVAGLATSQTEAKSAKDMAAQKQADAAKLAMDVQAKDAEIAKGKTDLEALKANTVPKEEFDVRVNANVVKIIGSAGVSPLEGNPSTPPTDASKPKTFMELVEEKIEAGMTRGAAITACVNSHPKLFETYRNSIGAGVA